MRRSGDARVESSLLWSPPAGVGKRRRRALRTLAISLHRPPSGWPDLSRVRATYRRSLSDLKQARAGRGLVPLTVAQQLVDVMTCAMVSTRGLARDAPERQVGSFGHGHAIAGAGSSPCGRWSPVADPSPACARAASSLSLAPGAPPRGNWLARTDHP